METLLTDPEVISGEKLFFDLHASFSEGSNGEELESFIDSGDCVVEFPGCRSFWRAAKMLYKVARNSAGQEITQSDHLEEVENLSGVLAVIIDSTADRLDQSNPDCELIRGVKEGQFSHQLFYLKYLLETQPNSDGKFLEMLRRIGGVGILVIAALDDLRYIPYCFFEDDTELLISLFETLNFANVEVTKHEAVENASPVILQKLGNRARKQRKDESAEIMQRRAMEIWSASGDSVRTPEVAAQILKEMQADPSRYGLKTPVKKENVLKKIRPIAPDAASKRGPKPIK